MASEKHRTFREVIAHTAKCEKCGRYNKSILYRCIECSFPICTPCWNAEGGTGRHKNIAITESPVILPPRPPNKTKKKDKSATKTARPRKNVAVSDSETDDEEMPDAAAETEKPKTQSMSMQTDHTAASSNDETSREVHTTITNDAPNALTGLQYSEDVLRGADLLLGFFHAADTPTSASSTTSCSTNSGLAAVLDATGTIDRRPDLSSTQQKPSASLTSDPAARLYELNKHYSRDDHPPLVPEKGHVDVDMNDYSSASSFTPINARKEITGPRETRKSPSDRFIHSRRPERPREATNDDRFARGLEIPGNRYEESDSDVEIVGARKLRHVGPSFGDGNGNADGIQYHGRPYIQDTVSFPQRVPPGSVYPYPTAPAEKPSGCR